jgi:hypothetical protein
MADGNGVAIDVELVHQDAQLVAAVNSPHSVLSKYRKSKSSSQARPINMNFTSERSRRTIFHFDMVPVPSNISMQLQ